MSFDSLPIYVKYYYEYTSVKKLTNNEKYVLLTGGNHLQSRKIEEIVDAVNYAKNKCKASKIYYLFSNVKNGICFDDEIFYERIKNIDENIEMLEVNKTDEWLSVIKKAEFLVSGRFHHSIAAFMLNTKFISFNANTYKMIGMLSMIDKTDSLVYNKDYKKVINNILKESNSLKDRTVRDMIVYLARKNYMFREEIE